jgi:hypothetical protein
MGLKPQMTFARKPKARAKPLDLVRRARLLGVTPGHLCRVLNGERISVSLTARLEKLLQSESSQTTETQQPKK